MTDQLELTKREVVDYEFFNLWLKETYPNFNGLDVSSDEDEVLVLWTEDMTSQEVIDITAYHSSLTASDLIETKYLKLFRYVASNGYEHTEPPKGLNYMTGLVTSLYPKRTFVKGELQKVEWYSDDSCTDKIICVGITYVRDELGFAQSRETIRKWMREDGTEHPNAKITHKDYTLNPTDITKEGKRRRGNNIDNSIIIVLNMMQNTIPLTHPEKTPTDILMDGRQFQSDLEPFILTYTNSSDKTIITKVEEAEDYWLDNDVSAMTGIPDQTIRLWMIEELSL